MTKLHKLYYINENICHKQFVDFCFQKLLKTVLQEEAFENLYFTNTDSTTTYTGEEKNLYKNLIMLLNYDFS